MPVARVLAAPDDVSVEDAAQLPLNPVTAWGLLQMADVKGPAWIGLTAPSSSVAKLVSASPPCAGCAPSKSRRAQRSFRS